MKQKMVCDFRAGDQSLRRSYSAVRATASPRLNPGTKVSRAKPSQKLMERKLAGYPKFIIILQMTRRGNLT